MISIDERQACADRVVIVTGAGRGLGRAHALELARQGAMVVVNDLGAQVDGKDPSATPAAEVAGLIVANGGQAVADTSDVADWDHARELVDSTVERFGSLHAIVNNAGILRDRTLVNMSIEEWDSVVRVHLRSTFCVSHWAAVHWRDRFQGEPMERRIINTTSGSGLYGNFGQVNYGAAKAGIAGFTVSASMELEKYGVTVNAISPAANTRMTAGLLDPQRAADLAPEHVSPVVAWLVSLASSGITGRVFNVSGRQISVANGWYAGPWARASSGWTAEELTDIVPRLIGGAAPKASLSGVRPAVGGAHGS